MLSQHRTAIALFPGSGAGIALEGFFVEDGAFDPVESKC
jgi:hypothetical protein